MVSLARKQQKGGGMKKDSRYRVAAQRLLRPHLKSVVVGRGDEPPVVQGRQGKDHVAVSRHRAEGLPGVDLLHHDGAAPATGDHFVPTHEHGEDMAVVVQRARRPRSWYPRS